MFLFGFGGESDDDDEGDDENIDDLSGAEMLSRHLAKCKLQHAEEVYSLRRQLRAAATEQDALRAGADQLQRDVSQYRGEIKRTVSLPIVLCSLQRAG